MNTGLVLSGGGARGAYTAGVLRYLYGRLAIDLPDRAKVDIISGNSVGALNGCWLAGYGRTRRSVEELSTLWREMEVSDIYTFEARDLFRSPIKIIRQVTAGETRGALLDARPLHEMVRRRFPFKGLRREISSGELKGLIISTTLVSTGGNVLWLDLAEDRNTRVLDPSVTMRRSHITPAHCLASTALPFLFEPVTIDDKVYVDGTLRQNTPISPVVQLGCDRVLVVSVKQEFARRSARSSNRENAPTSLAYLFGKVLNAMLLDPVERDLERLERENDIIEFIESNFGDEAVAALNSHLGSLTRNPYRATRSLIIRPSVDLGRVAAESFQAASKRMSRSTRLLLSAVAEREDAEEADLLSYLLFDSKYTAAIEQLGWEDARSMEAELVAFFTD